MLYRQDNRAGRSLSGLGFGCMRFPRKGGGFDMEKTAEMLYKAIDSGVNYLDTAYIYGGSEAALGQILSRDGMRDKVYLATKLPLFLVRSAPDFDKYFNKQLERLRTDRVEYYLMHMLVDMPMWQKLKDMGIEDWISRQKKEGRIGSIGFSYHGGRDQFPLILNDYDWDFVQIQYNYMDEFNQAGRSGMELAASKNIPVVVMEPLRGGKLAAELPREAGKIFSNSNPEWSSAEWGLRWLWNQPEVTVVLSGMSTMAQLEENLRVACDAAPDMLTDAQKSVYTDVKKAMESLIKVPCTACGYCMPCPSGVDIPTCFSCYNMIAEGKGTALRSYMQNINALGSDPHYAGKCTGCGKCEKHCPQHIAIRDKLKQVSGELEPWWFLSAMGICRAFTRQGKRRK